MFSPEADPDVPESTGDAALANAFAEGSEAPAAPVEPPASPPAPAAPPAVAPPPPSGRPDDTPPAIAPAPQEPAKAPEAAAPPSAEPEFPEFSVRADGQVLSIPGSAVGEDGIFIPKSALPQVEQLLAYGQVHQGSFRQRLSESAQREQQAMARADAAEREKAAVLDRFEAMVEAHLQGRSDLQDWLNGVAQNWPVMRAESRVKALEARNQYETQRLQQYEAQQQETQLRPIMEQRLEQALVALGERHGVETDALAQLYQRYLQTPGMLETVFPRATQDDPVSGVKAGQRYDVQLALLEREVQWLGGLVKGRTPVAQKPPAKPPPTVAAGRGPAPTAVQKVPAVKSPEEADALLDAAFKE